MKCVFHVALYSRPSDRNEVSYREVTVERDARWQAVDAFWDALRTAGFTVGNIVVPEAPKSTRCPNGHRIGPYDMSCDYDCEGK